MSAASLFHRALALPTALLLVVGVSAVLTARPAIAAPGSTATFRNGTVAIQHNSRVSVQVSGGTVGTVAITAAPPEPSPSAARGRARA